MPYLRRHYQKRLKNLLGQFPVVCILGPRQCGKTTFVKKELKGYQYLDLEKPSHYSRLADDIEYFFSRSREPFILDEAQLFPPLFPALRSFVDETLPKKGRVVLLGSASFNLIQNLSESLAGRVGFLDMAPFGLSEVKDMDSLWLKGGFPKAYLEKNHDRRFDWFEAYTRTFIEQDLNRLGISISATQMRKLWGMLANLHGGLWNASEIASALGTNYHTVNRYVDILEQTFLVRKLSPYFVNIGKRLIKSPKIYFRDTGLLHYFLGIQTKGDLETHPKRGMSWEGFVIEQIIHFSRLHYPPIEPYFWHTATHQEVDLVLKKGSRLIPLEIKTHSAPDRSMLGGLVHCLFDLGLEKGYVIYPGKDSYFLAGGKIQVLSLVLWMKKLIDNSV